MNGTLLQKFARKRNWKVAQLKVCLAVLSILYEDKDFKKDALLKGIIKDLKGYYKKFKTSYEKQKEYFKKVNKQELKKEKEI